jgi:hypothetical protein
LLEKAARKTYDSYSKFGVPSKLDRDYNLDPSLQWVWRLCGLVTISRENKPSWNMLSKLCAEHMHLCLRKLSEIALTSEAA